MCVTTLKILREIKNYTQKYVGEEVLGISQNTYSRLESNPKKITAEQAQKLSAFYMVDIVILLTEALPVISFEEQECSDIQKRNQNESGELKNLREEVKYLRKQNEHLLRLLEERK